MKHEKQTALSFALTFLVLFTGACDRTPNDPAATLASACDAVKRKDVEAYKQTLAAAKWSNLQTLAAHSNLVPEDLLKQMMSNITCPDRTQTSAAHFQGETATLNVKSAGSDEIESFRFVREDGDWKFAD
ncbi:MAG: hypothetical protein LC803_19180 [Acidobacteria bacterium]|nr:hypothetical protein [Acidobacteriota bacterium]